MSKKLLRRTLEWLEAGEISAGSIPLIEDLRQAVNDSEEWISTKHLTFGFVDRMLVCLNKFVKDEGNMEDIMFVLLQEDNPISQMLTGKFVIQLKPKKEL